MRGYKYLASAAGLVVVGLLATACGTTPSPSASSTGEPGGSTAPTASGPAEITINGCTPENPLIPGNTSEVCGGNVIDAFAAKLVHYNSDTAEPEMDIASAIETTDNQTFTVKLNPGYKFHDGTEVKAKNFVDAWNYTANGKNGYAGGYFMSMIEGWDQVQCGYDDAGDPDCTGKPPAAETMSGLAVVDDTTFTIKTTEKVSNLPVRLGYSAFAPMPDSFFADPKAYEAKPIGAGPFQLTSKTDTEMVLEKFADYSGKNVPSVDKVTFKIYTDGAAAYADVVANNLDIMDMIPNDQLVGDLYKSDLPDRNAQLETGSLRWITYSPADEQLKNNVDLRKAISMAIDRQAIVDQVLSGAGLPAASWVSPAVDGYLGDTCGEACVFDAAKAKALYDKAGGYKGTLTYTTNTTENPVNQAIGEAIVNQLKNNLGIDAAFNSAGDFATFNKGIDAGEYQGIFRSGWQMDYPSIENFLAPIYAKGADSNWSKYDNPEFMKLLTEAAAAPAGAESNAKYQEAEKLLAQDFPTAPLTFAKTTIGWSDRLQPVKITPFGTPDLLSVKLK